VSVLKGLSWSVAGTLLKVIVGTEIFDEKWHPVIIKVTTSTANVVVRATRNKRDTIDLHPAGLIADETILSLVAILVNFQRPNL
jgi:hypothetical protein